MALTVSNLAAALRITDGSAEPEEPTLSILNRLLGVSEAFVSVAEGAPDAVVEEAQVRLCGYLYDQPTSGRRDSYANAFRNSGAAALVARWVPHRAGEAALNVSSPTGTIDDAAVLALIAVWAHEGNDDQIPASKLHNAGGGQGTGNDAVARATASDALAATVANALEIAALEHPVQWAVEGDNGVIPDDKVARQIYAQSGALNINVDQGHTPGDVVIEIVSGVVKVYQRNTSGPPYYTLVGSTTTQLLSNIASWALTGNTDEIPAGKFPFAIPDWLASPLTHDIPWSLLNSTLHLWTEAINTDLIPDAKLPVTRFLPNPVGAAEGQIAKIVGGVWTIGDDLQGESGGDVTDAEYERIAAPMSYGTDNTAELSCTAWRDYEWLVCVFKRTQDSVDYPFWVNVHTLNHETDIEVPLEQNAKIDLSATAGSDSITFGNLAGVTGSPANSDTIEVWGYKPPFRTTSIDGGGLTAAGITGLTTASNDEVHTNAIFAGVFSGVLRKFSFHNLINLMRSTVGLGRQINPTGSTGNLGKVPVLHEDGADFHYQLQSPVELPSIASNVPNNPDQLNPAIIYKDTPEGDTANELYYKRKHDRESVIIAINDTSPRSFGTEHRSFGWTSRIILDTAEPVPGVQPYPSAPPHWEAFIRVQNIASGLYEWRLYTDELFTTLDTIYLDMRDQDDPDTHIENVGMTKPVNEAYWTTGTYTFNTFPFYGIAGRARRPIIRIRNADDTLSTSIIHLIPVDDVREALVDEDRLHDVYADILDLVSQHLENLPAGGGFPTNRTAVFTATATGNSQSLHATEAWIPNQLYELVIGNRTAHLFMTTASGALRPHIQRAGRSI